MFKAEGNKYRELFLWIIIFIFLSALPIKLIFFQKSDFSAGKEFSSKASLRKSVLLAKRGEILDRNNLVLAEDIPSYEIGLTIKNFSFDPTDIKAISETLGHTSLKTTENYIDSLQDENQNKIDEALGIN